MQLHAIQWKEKEKKQGVDKCCRYFSLQFCTFYEGCVIAQADEIGILWKFLTNHGTQH
jgi:hypothetical protein